MDENEKNLFSEHLQATDKVIQPGISRFKWSSKSQTQDSICIIRFERNIKSDGIIMSSIKVILPIYLGTYT